MRYDGQPGVEDRDRAEIIAVIEAETATWMRRDLTGWEACWAHVDYARRLSARVDTGVGASTGFQTSRRNVATFMQRCPEPFGDPRDVRRDNWVVRIGADMAWVTFDQHVAMGEKHIPGTHYQLRILERHQGCWKIVVVTELQPRLGFYTCPWVRLDVTGRILEVSASAARLLPGHPALRAAGGSLVGHGRADTARLHQALAQADRQNRDEATAGYMPVILSDTDDGSLAVCWIASFDWMLVVLFDDDSLIDAALLRAARAFGLSPGQARVARQIAMGHDLPEAAKLLGIGLSTVRTHVKRMFDRVGVNSQASLIRALMSVDAPRLLP